MVDLFAAWFLLSDPHIRAGSIGSNMTFGFRETYNGVGVFFFKESQDYKLVALENHGNEQVTLAKLGKSFKNGVNGCIIDTSILEKEFVLRTKMDTGQLTVTYGPKLRQSSHKTCLQDLYMPNLANQGYVGVTARNSDRYVKDLELNQIKVMNLDPRFYTHEEEYARQQELLQTGQDERNQEQIYTDELTGRDVLEEYEDRQEELDQFIAENLGNIFSEDTLAEVLYKMNEHMNIILGHVSHFVSNEELMQRYVKDHQRLPEIIKTFENLPKAIEDESNFV